MNNIILVSFALITLLNLVSGGPIFNCPALPAHSPKDINDLTPGNIKVIAALGDSITAGFGMYGLSGGANEIRGQSYAIGADNNATSINNFLKFYSPSIQGGSLGSHVVEYCGGSQCPPFQYRPQLDVFNAAQSGAEAINLQTHELDYLISQMKANPRVNMKEDWKVLTIFIGANDLCSTCPGNLTDPAVSTSPDQFEQDLRNTLEKIRLNIPRVFVNLVEIFNLSQVYTLSQSALFCKTVHRSFPAECGCVFQPGQKGDETRKAVDVMCQLYNARVRNIAASYKGKYPEFAVIDQPIGRNTAIVDFPLNFLSTLDCFHPSLFGHQALAIALWNSMITPEASKPTSVNPKDLTIKCPTANDRLYTS